MKRIFLNMVLLMVSVCMFAEITVQMEQANKLYEMDTIRGQAVYLYPVQQSEGLYRISKNFGVSQEDIIKYNPDLKESGLRYGQIIKIPVYERFDSTKYVVHELQPKETLYGLGRKYGVRISQIQKLNPETAKRMNIGDRLLIRLKTEDELAAEVRTEQPADIVRSREKRDALKGGLLADSVRLARDSVRFVRDSALVMRDSARIGRMKEVTTLIERSFRRDTVIRMERDTFAIIAESQQDTVSAAYITETPIRIAFLLPFMVDATKRDAALERFVEFYEGALLAINEAQHKGQRFEIYTFDTEKSEARVDKVLQRAELQNVDFIVGPAYPAQVARVSAFAAEQHIPVLIPFTSQVADLEKNPYLLQFNVSEAREAEEITNYLLAKGDSVNVVLVADEGKPLPESIALIRNQIKKSGISTTETTMHLVAVDSIQGALREGKQNYILFPTERYVQVQPLMERLQEQRVRYDVRLLARYAWAKERLPINYVYTSVFKQISVFDIEQNKYDLQYKYFFRQPVQNQWPRYDLLGYDLTNYVIGLMQQDAALTLDERVQALDWQGLQAGLKLQKKGEKGGYENTAVRVVEQ